ncbi:MAG: 6,7-dimethyl-8-ribityllumazine synthase [Gammaproteobacteria bacterium]|nr:MAG: 6,7-dimethyl-8-ribityllumazine synthase [Gammaproteobacteria bacterium]
MRIFEGKLTIRDERFCIVAARFNDALVQRLIDGALDCLRRHGADDSQLHLVRVPGAFELPLAVQRVAASRQYDGIVALGVVIRGATPHFDHVCAQAAAGLQRASLDSGLPVGFGLLTCDSIEQVIERAGTKAGNKGADAALSTIEMVKLLRQLDA